MTTTSVSKICSVAGCNFSNNRIRRGLCDFHWKQQKPLGFPTPEERFWSRINTLPGQGPNGDCWEWTGGLAGTGYGSIRFRTRYMSTHVLAWELTHNRRPATGCHILHSCDNRRCCNPIHLREGTPVENAQDATERQRRPVGEQATMSKLTANDVQWIREHGATQTLKAMARIFNVAPATISDAKLRRTWRWLD